jgi:alpha-N-arabinofuranosidase
MVRYAFLLLCVFTLHPRAAAQTIAVDPRAEPINVTPLLYGQFIEHLGRSIDGGIYEENSPLSDERGFRTDVLDLVKELNVPLLRFPGGTVTKIYHWEYGIGPKDERPKRPNLIWGGNINYRFGTAEFIAYCRELGAEPFLVVNMATGTPEEASNWVEYCNGTGDTHYANLRRAHGYPEPFNVTYWGIGNEESAEADAGRHQDPEDYVDATWQFSKLMKLQDPSIKLTMVGDTRDREWNQYILDELHPVTDYLAVHFYAVPRDSSYASLLESVYQYGPYLDTLREQLAELPQTGGLSRWYRFAGRDRPLELAVDEWGIWYMDSPLGEGTYALEYPYRWRDALATAVFLHLFYRNADIIGLATWAQTVNVLAPIMTSPEGSRKQTVHTPLAKYREHMLERTLPLKLSDIPSLPSGRAALDAVATVAEDGERMVIAVINLSPDEAHAPEFNLDGTGYRLQRRLLYASEREGVRERTDGGREPQEAGSIGFYFFTK